MSENLTPLERQLASWTPRRPSVGLERRLFARPAEPAPASRSARQAWPWLAPVTCACVFAFCVSNYIERTGPAAASRAAEAGSASAAEVSEPSSGFGRATTPSIVAWNTPPAASELALAGRALSITGSVPSLYTSILKTNF